MSAWNELADDLVNKPVQWFDVPTAVQLDAFLRGYAAVDPNLTRVLNALGDALRKQRGCRIAASAGSIVYATEPDLRTGYAVLAKSFQNCAGLAQPADDVTIHSVTALLPILRSAASPVAAWQIRELRSYFRGAFRALEDHGVDIREDDKRMNEYDHWLRQRFGLSGRWDRVIEVLDLGKGKSVPFFVRTFQTFLRQRGELVVN
ncbi:MAG TPA: hypothetical protein QGF58_10620 [Myxococcota bacterium]|nr:hypothetical protein [Myxococcota bacterium]